MTESIHDRLDREAAQLKSGLVDGVIRFSESFIAGVEHAATIAYRMSAQAAAAAEHDTPSTITVVLNRDDARRIFQAMAHEQARLSTADVEEDYIDHARDLAEKARQWALALTGPIEGTESSRCVHPADQTASAGGLLVCHVCAQVVGSSPDPE